MVESKSCVYVGPRTTERRTRKGLETIVSPAAHTHTARKRKSVLALAVGTDRMRSNEKKVDSEVDSGRVSVSVCVSVLS